MILVIYFLLVTTASFGSETLRRLLERKKKQICICAIRIGLGIPFKPMAAGLLTMYSMLRSSSVTLAEPMP